MLLHLMYPRATRSSLALLPPFFHTLTDVKREEKLTKKSFGRHFQRKWTRLKEREKWKEEKEWEERRKKTGSKKTSDKEKIMIRMV